MASPNFSVKRRKWTVPTPPFVYLIADVLEQPLDDQTDSLVAKQFYNSGEVRLSYKPTVNLVYVVIPFRDLLKEERGL